MIDPMLCGLSDRLGRSPFKKLKFPSLCSCEVVSCFLLHPVVRILSRAGQRSEHTHSAKACSMLGVAEAPRVLLQPSLDSIAAVFQTCRMQREHAPALRLHVYMRKSGLASHMSIGTHLVSMLVDVESMFEAHHVFDRLFYRDESSWNTLISGYITCQKPHEAFALFWKMRRDDSLHPSCHIFVGLLKTCAKLQDMERALEMHVEAEALGLPQTDVFVGSALVDMFAKCGSFAKAQQIFVKLCIRNAVTWNALINAYVENDCFEEALKCFKQMQLEGFDPTVATYVCSLKACAYLNYIEKGKALHTEVERKGLLEREILIGSSLVDMYVKCRLLVNAQEVFNKLPFRNVVVWTILIGGYIDHEDGEAALKCFEQMQFEGVSSNAATLTCCLKACGTIGAIDLGLEMHAEVERRGFTENNIVVGNSLIDMYAKCGLLVKARELFYSLPVRNAISWTTLITAYIEHGFAEEALECFEQMQLEDVAMNIVVLICGLKACKTIGAVDKGQEIHMDVASKGLLEDEFILGGALVDMYAKCGWLAEAQNVSDNLLFRDVISWNAVIGGYVEHFHGEEAVKSFEKMRLEGISPSGVTYLCTLKACGSIGAIDKGREIHGEIERQGWLERDFVVGNTLVDMYAKCGLLAIAQQVFDKLLVRDIVSCNSLIAGYVQIGESGHAFYIFDRILEEGLKPDMVTFVLVLNMCSRRVLFHKSATVFEAMSKDHGIVPAIEHLTCMVDLLARLGELDKAVAIMKDMPCNPNLEAWLTMLGACRTSGNLGIAKQAFEHALGSDDRDASSYVLMSQILASIN